MPSTSLSSAGVPCRFGASFLPGGPLDLLSKNRIGELTVRRDLAVGLLLADRKRHRQRGDEMAEHKVVVAKLRAIDVGWPNSNLNRRVLTRLID